MASENQKCMFYPNRPAGGKNARKLTLRLLQHRLKLFFALLKIRKFYILPENESFKPTGPEDISIVMLPICDSEARTPGISSPG